MQLLREHMNKKLYNVATWLLIILIRRSQEYLFISIHWCRLAEGCIRTREDASGAADKDFFHFWAKVIYSEAKVPGPRVIAGPRMSASIIFSLILTKGYVG
jgi:hypothetical protein